MILVNFSIIIPNLNGAEYLIRCLPSLQEAIKLCPKSKFEVILVDNASSDDSINIFNDYLFDSSRTLIQDKNYGFAGAVNKGINQAKYDYVVICNNDLTLDPKWFKEISSTITANTNPKITTFSGLVLNKEGTHIESQGLKFFYKGKAKNIDNGKPFFGNCDLEFGHSHLIWGASASLVVYQKDILQKIGLFDEDFFAYEEDVDLSFRLQKAGYLTLFIPSAISYHLGGGTSKKMGNFRHRMDAKNWIYLILKNYSRKEITTNFFLIFEERLRNLSGLVKNTPFWQIPYWLLITYSTILFHIPAFLKKRKMVN